MPNGNQPGFDVDAARQAGYSDDEILSHLTSSRNFDINGALQAGYSKADIIQHLASTPAPSAGLSVPSNLTISAQPKPAGWLGSAENYLSELMGDVKYGTGVTLPGRALKALGAPGLYSGEPEAVGNYMGSPVLGTLRAAQGATQIPQGKVWEGTKNVVGGALEAGQIPMAFMGGPATEAGAEGASTVAGKVFGDAEKAGQLFEKVKGAVGGETVPVTDEMSQAAMRASELAERGAKGLPKVITRFIQRVTDPEKPAIGWNEFRDFMSNVSRLSANEYNSMNPQMAAQVSKLAGAMKDAAQGVAEAGGVGDEFSQAMQLYARSKAWQKFGAEVWAGFKRAILPGAIGGGIGYQAGKRLSDLMQAP